MNRCCLDLIEIQKFLPQNVIKGFWHVEDNERQVSVLNFIFIRNLLRLQYAFKAHHRTRHESAVRIQRAVKQVKER